MTGLSDLYDLIVNGAMLDDGASPAVLASRGAAVVRSVKKETSVSNRTNTWTEEEDRFLQDNLGRMPLDELTKSLGRSANSLKLRSVRKGYTPPTKVSGWISANKAGELLGLDSHTVPNWFRLGVIPGRYACTKNADIIMINLDDLKFWATRSRHWPYFKVDRMPPGHLRWLVEKAQARWGDEWLTTAQVAEMHGLKDAKAVLMDIKHGRLPAIQCRHIDGRGKGTWAHWFVRKSDALAYQHPSRSDARKSTWYTDQADAYLRNLVADGRTSAQAARLMKQNEKYLAYRMSKIRKEKR